MADDAIRRSGRANKGHHTKNADALDEPPKPKPKSKPDKKTQAQEKAQAQAQAQEQEKEKEREKEKEKEKLQMEAEAAATEPVVAEDEDEDEDVIYRCVCGEQREIRGRDMICCDKCHAWQHNKCLNLPPSEAWGDNDKYYCEQCEPGNHQELLAAIARGEKPWSRKKGAKAARPKYNPSNAHSEASGRPDTATPQPTPAAEPSPAPASQKSPQPSTDGHVDAKPSKKSASATKSRSPTGEKRSHDAIDDKENASSKRRKSSVQQTEEQTPQVVQADMGQKAMATDTAHLPPKQKMLTEKLIESLSSLIKTASESRGYRIPDGATPSSVATRLALQIDHAIVKHHGAPVSMDFGYAERLRKVMFNTKKNSALLDRLLDGSLSPDELASMNTEQMASEDKQKEWAAVREAQEKQSVLVQENGPRLRKTHKGDEIIGDDYMDLDIFRPPEPRPEENNKENAATSQETSKEDGGETVELPEHSKQPLSVDTAAAPDQPDQPRRTSSQFDINAVFDKVRSPQHDQQAFLKRRASSIREKQTPQERPVEDADVDRLLKDEDNDVDMIGYSADPTIVWRGALEMQALGSFDAAARFVAGGDFGQVIPWEELLTKRLPIQGRIDHERGNDYIQGLAANGTHDVGVLVISPVNEESSQVFNQIFEYFHPRKRWGVVPVDKLNSPAMRDLYVIPVDHGEAELPGFLNMLEYCTIETPRKVPLLLLALVAKLPETQQPQPPQQSTQSTPVAQMHPHGRNGSTNGPSPNPNGPQYSPVQPVFPPNTAPYGAPVPPPYFHPTQPGQQQQPFPFPPSNHQQTPLPPLPYPPPHLPTATPPRPIPTPQSAEPTLAQLQQLHPQANTILGPMLDTPVARQLLGKNATISPELLHNLRDILEKEPGTRTDLNMFMQYLNANNQNRHQGEGNARGEGVTVGKNA